MTTWTNTSKNSSSYSNTSKSSTSYTNQAINVVYSKILLESGFNILLESGSNLLLEATGVNDTWTNLVKS